MQKFPKFEIHKKQSQADYQHLTCGVVIQFRTTFKVPKIQLSAQEMQLSLSNLSFLFWLPKTQSFKPSRDCSEVLQLKFASFSEPCICLCIFPFFLLANVRRGSMTSPKRNLSPLDTIPSGLSKGLTPTHIPSLSRIFNHPPPSACFPSNFRHQQTSPTLTKMYKQNQYISILPFNDKYWKQNDPLLPFSKHPSAC